MCSLLGELVTMYIFTIYLLSPNMCLELTHRHRFKKTKSLFRLYNMLPAQHYSHDIDFDFFFHFFLADPAPITNSIRKSNKDSPQHPIPKKKKAGVKSFSLNADIFPFGLASA